MNIHANYQIVPLSTGMNSFAQYSSSTYIHQVYCLTAGTITLSALGTGEATFSLTANQYVNIVLSQANVASGVFIGFRSKASNVGLLTPGMQNFY